MTAAAALEWLWLMGLACGVSWVISCSVIGYWPRFLWCVALKWTRVTRYFWNIATCPACNGWWVGGLVAWWWGYEFYPRGLAMAFMSCLAMAILQARYGLQPGEDMEVVFGLKEKSDGEG